MFRSTLCLLVWCSIAACQEEDLPECRDGDLPCYTQTGHREFSEGNYPEAMRWYEMAVDHHAAVDALGFAYETGQGKPKDPAEAAAKYRSAAEAGYDMGQLLLHL